MIDNLLTCELLIIQIRSRTRGEAATTQRTVPQIRGRLRQRTTTTPAPEEVLDNEEAPVQRKPVFRAQVSLKITFKDLNLRIYPFSSTVAELDQSSHWRHKRRSGP